MEKAEYLIKEKAKQCTKEWWIFFALINMSETLRNIMCKSIYFHITNKEIIYTIYLNSYDYKTIHQYIFENIIEV